MPAATLDSAICWSGCPQILRCTLCPASSASPSPLPGYVLRVDPKQVSDNDFDELSSERQEALVTRYRYGVGGGGHIVPYKDSLYGEGFAKFLVVCQ